MECKKEIEKTSFIRLYLKLLANGTVGPIFKLLFTF